jgi:hypothetical protein
MNDRRADVHHGVMVYESCDVYGMMSTYSVVCTYVCMYYVCTMCNCCVMYASCNGSCTMLLFYIIMWLCVRD